VGKKSSWALEPMALEKSGNRKKGKDGRNHGKYSRRGSYRHRGIRQGKGATKSDIDGGKKMASAASSGTP